MNLFEDPIGNEQATVSPAVPRRPSILPLLIKSARSRPITVLALTIVFACMAIVAIEKKMRPSYAAETLVYVDPVTPRVLNADEEWHKESFVGFYDDYMRTLAREMKSLAVVAKAVEELEEADLGWAADEVPREELVPHLRARLEVRRVLDTHLLSVMITDVRQEIPAELANAVVRTFIDYLEERRGAESDEVLGKLDGERQRLSKGLDDTYVELDKLTDRLGSAILDERQNIFYERMQVLQEGLTKIFVRRVAAEGDLRATQGRADELLAEVPAGEVAVEVEADVRVRDARVMISRRIREVEDALIGLAAKHSRHKLLTARKKALQIELAEIEETAKHEVRERLESQRKAEAERILGEARRELESARLSEESMNAVLAEARTELADYGRAMFLGSQLRARARNILSEIDRVDARAATLRVERFAPPRLRIQEWAVTPTRPDGDKRGPLRIVAMILAAGGALVTATMLEVFRAGKKS